VIHCNHFRDVVQLDRSSEIVPEGLFPIPECRCDHTDCSTGKGELTVLARQVASLHVPDRPFRKTRIDAGKKHCFIFSRRAERKRRKGCSETSARGKVKEMPPVKLNATAASACEGVFLQWHAVLY
jgi:hypothetical protein